ncbi:conserved hypothetical protein [Xenorhabdus nematophila F1]|nr:conserved hypothetical protein [Xenorhabdus nematophila F1]
MGGGSDPASYLLDLNLWNTDIMILNQTDFECFNHPD